ncbi:MAG: hypothetical protein Q8K24_05865 [Hydrogenophaga sp.]|nr:hypothetical protein [Hydrogenophaga sp.]
MENHKANDIFLSVISDGSIYEDRKHIGFAMLQGASHRGMTFRDLAERDAKTQRAKFNSKYKASDISEAGRAIQAATIEHCIEFIRDEYDKTKRIKATCRRWFDKVNGNSYYGVHIDVPTVNYWRQVNIPYQNGYGNQWQFDTVRLLQKIGILETKMRANGTIDYEFMSDYPIDWLDMGYGKKRDMYDGIHI